MPYTNFENGISRVNDVTLNAMQKGLMQLVFPIGSTYITQTNTDPNTILGFGTWERLNGKVCLGLDENDEELDQIGKTGGSKKHTLTKEELPNIKIKLETKGAGSGVNETSQWGVNTTEQDNMGDIFTENLGNGQAFNIRNPYEVVGYMWIRRA